MFKFLKRKRASEADFDIFSGKSFHDVDFSKQELVMLFLDWTQYRNKMSALHLREPIRVQVKGVRSPFSHLPLHEQASIARLISKDAIVYWKALKLIKKVRGVNGSDYQITKRGEQIRQFYVMKLGMRGGIFDRMDLFTKA